MGVVCRREAVGVAPVKDGLLVRVVVIRNAVGNVEVRRVFSTFDKCAQQARAVAVTVPHAVGPVRTVAATHTAQAHNENFLSFLQVFGVVLTGDFHPALADAVEACRAYAKGVAARVGRVGDGF